MKKTLVLALCIIGLAFPAISAPRMVKTFTSGTQATILLFVGSTCPCMDAHRLMIQNMLKEIDGAGVTFYCVFSNQDETRDLVDHFFRQIGWDCPYIMDSSGKLADRYGATNTPEAIVLDPARQIVFRGPIDDSSKNLGRVTKAYLSDALHDIMDGRPVRVAEVQPTGCWLVTRTGVKTPPGLLSDVTPP